MRPEFPRADIADIFDYKHCDHKDTMRSADGVLRLAMERKDKRDWNHALEKAIRYGWDNCGAQPGELLTGEHRRKIVELMGEKLDPWHRRPPLRNRRFPRQGTGSIPRRQRS